MEMLAICCMFFLSDTSEKRKKLSFIIYYSSINSRQHCSNFQEFFHAHRCVIDSYCITGIKIGLIDRRILLVISLVIPFFSPLISKLRNQINNWTAATCFPWSAISIHGTSLALFRCSWWDSLGPLQSVLGSFSTSTWYTAKYLKGCYESDITQLISMD